VTLALLPLLPACDTPLDPAGQRSTGLAATRDTGGPRVLWDILAEPLPELPLPNDAATRIDPTSPTGRRLNISIAAADTEYERDTRRKFNGLDGFGIFSPIVVSFDAPLDLADLARRHGTNDDFRDDAVFLLNVDPDCQRFGEEVTLNIGRRRFPQTLFTRAGIVPDESAPGGFRVDESSSRVFPYDAWSTYNNILFEERNEDVNGNGILDPGEDLDGDGVLDVANFIDPTVCDGFARGTLAHDQCVADNLMGFYDRTSNTLILRPIWPLEQQCTYAVVLTQRLRGEDGRPVMSPFSGVNPRDQTRALAPVADLLPRYGLGVEDIAFAWTFTTGTQTRDFEALRAGLYGHGVFAQLGAEFPVSAFRVDRLAELADPDGPTEYPAGATVLSGACAGAAVTLLWARGQSEWGPNMCAMEADWTSLSAFFSGTFSAPNLMVDTDGRATPRYPDDHDEYWKLDYLTGEITYGRTEPRFICGLPLELDTSCSPGNPEGRPFCRPFPVILYAHGYGSAKGESLSHIGRHTAMGYAACGIDSFGHGLNRALEDPVVGSRFNLARLLFAPFGADVLMQMVLAGRDRDLNNDGLSDPGADQWTADLFHTRDMVRQHALEFMQMLRILRAMDGTTRGDDGGLLGDVDGDGRVDLGGPRNIVGMWGISLGGIVAGVLAGIEPGFDAVSPNAGGASLTDVTARLGQGGLPEAVLLPMLGPFMAGCIPIDQSQNPLTEGEGGRCFPQDGREGSQPAGELTLGWYAYDFNRFATHVVATLQGVQAGDIVRLTNLDKNITREARITERGWFRLSVPADALDPLERRPLLGLTDESTQPVAYANTPELGDRVRIEVLDATGTVSRGVVDTFQREITFQGTTYPEGAPLVVLQKGLAYQRNSPDFRRFVAIAQTAITLADPGAWGAQYIFEPVDVSHYDPNTPTQRMRVLIMPTVGDTQVPASTGVSMARASGLLGSWIRDPERYPAEHGWRELFMPDPRYGHSIERELEERWVIEADPRLQRYGDNPINPFVLYDIDDLSDGTARFSCGDSDWSAIIGENRCPPEVAGQEIFFDVPNPAPGNALRLNRPRGDGTFDAFRIPLLRPAGQHGIYNAQSFREFDADAFAVNFTSRFLGSGGRLVDHPATCDCSASGLPSFLLEDFPEYPGRSRACQPDDLKLCTETCAQAWGIRTPEAANCEPL
jgi:hypothetical protein